jgi:lysophospholipase L1-like esterase
MRGFLRIAAVAWVATVVACAREPEPAADVASDAPGSLLSVPWTVTWAASPQPPLPGNAETFANSQPIRLIVRTSVGGERMRVRFSNLFGTTPLRINAARIALRGQGAGIDAASDHQVTFDNATTATVAPGQEVVSDAVDFAMPAFADLAITFWLTGDQVATTTHVLAQQTGYVGDAHAEAGATFKVARTLDSWPFLASVEVQAPGAMTIAVLGDSTVDGDGSTSDTNKRWPDFLAHHFNLDRSRVGIANLGLIGNRLLADSPADHPIFGTALGRAGVDRLDADLERLPSVSCVILRLGVNDIGFPGSFTKDAPVTSVALIEGYRRAAAAVRAKGARVIGTTITPFEGAKFEGYYSAAKEKVREEVNAWLRTTKDFDGVIDADVALRDPAHPSKLLAEFDSGDHLHPGDAGNERLAAATPLSICAGPVVQAK